jgi:hypothetical protein
VSVRKEGKERNRVRSTSKVQLFGVVIYYYCGCVRCTVPVPVCLRQEGGPGERAMVDIFSAPQLGFLITKYTVLYRECCMEKEAGRYSGRLPGF